MNYDTAEFTLPGVEENEGLVHTFVRVTPKPRPVHDVQSLSARRLSLLFLHCVTSHKETWIPTIEELFRLQNMTPNNVFTIVEAWSMDAPSHGRSAILNEAILMTLPEATSGRQWAKGVQSLLKSGFMAGNCDVVGIGHSAGATILIQSVSGYPLDRLPYSSMVLIEPGMPTPELLKKAREENAPLIRVIGFAKARKDLWPSRAAAREWLATRIPWRRWDQHVLDLFIEHALRDLPTMAYPDKTSGVTFALTRKDEAHGYTHYEDGFEALEILTKLCTGTLLPVHAIFGEVLDMLPAELHRSVASEDGRKMRSIVRIAGAGHLAVQENPRGVALAIWGILHENHALPMPGQLPSRL
ncbi:alpha/beta-hydrolase [Pilatotrama ljubarskyi]|nr:alpha/beta-hydrolase [Pilatotrama ljubarskyi]